MIEKFERANQPMTLKNPVVQELKEAGKRIIGYTCTNFPEEIVYAAGLIPVLRINRLDLDEALKEGQRSATVGRSRHRVARVLVAAQVAPHKKIRLVEITDEIPKSLSGKILRRVLVDRERGVA